MIKDINPYKTLVNSLPSFIVNLKDFPLTEKKIKQLKDNIALYQKLYVEIGSGSGKHLACLAKNNPDALCVGFEFRYKRAFRSAEKAKKAGINNICIILADAKQYWTKLLAKNSIDKLFMLFPDPWQKKRWQKHRFINQQFPLLLKQQLKKRGEFIFKTDSFNYFSLTCSIFLNSPSFKIIEKKGGFIYSNNAYISEFESLFKSKKHPIYQLICQRY